MYCVMLYSLGKACGSPSDSIDVAPWKGAKMSSRMDLMEIAEKAKRKSIFLGQVQARASPYKPMHY
jgi:hypothetical protein